MLGRTNTSIMSGISLNATIEEKEVEKGNIVAGDFVEYKNVKSIIDTGSTWHRMYNVNDNIIDMSVSDKRFILIDKVTTASLDAYNNVDDFCFNDDYVFLYHRSGNLVSKVKIENGAFRLIGTLDISDLQIAMDSYNVKYATIACDKNVLYVIYAAKSGSYYNYKVAKYDINSLSLLGDVKLLGPSSKETFNQPLRTTMGNNLLNGYVIVRTDGGGTSSNFYAKFSVRSDGTFSTLQEQYLKVTYDTDVVHFGDKVLYTNISISSSDSSMDVYVKDLATDIVHSTNISIYRGEHSTNIRQYIGNNMFVSYGSVTNKYDAGIAIYRLDESTLKLSIISETPSSKSPAQRGAPFTFVVVENVLYIYYVGDSKIYKKDITPDGFVVDSQDKSYVKKWEGGANPIGVAKDSGSQGEKIDVYIPSV